MTAVRFHLSRLGLAQYAEQFIEEGFESWDTVLDITESDLDRLNVKLGHRRVLQKAIAQERGTTVEQLSGISASTRYSQGDDGSTQGMQGTQVGEDHHECDPKPKRKYRRHPKQDENAPIRPPSAYVIFSNQVRDELSLTVKDFTMMAKLVGERWQALDPEEKGAIESKASALKKDYNDKMTAYKTTDEHRRYQDYLADFKEEQANRANVSGGQKRHASNERRSDIKQPRLGQTSPESSTSHIDSRHSPHGVFEQRSDYLGSMSAYSPDSSLPSPGIMIAGTLRGGPFTQASLGVHSPSLVSPSASMMHREPPSSFKTPSLLHPRPITEPSADPPPPPAHLSQWQARESISNRSESPSTTVESRSPRNQGSPARGRSSSSQAPALLHQPASTSSNISSGSQLSSTSTAPSSLFSARSHEEEQRPQLPPISATGFKPSGSSSLADYSLRKGSTPDSHMSPALSHQHLTPSQFSPARESLDTPPGHLMRNLTMQQTSSESRLSAPQGPPRDMQPQQPKSRSQPSLPSIRPSPSPLQKSESQSSEGDRLALLLDAANADPDRDAGSTSRPSS